MSIYNLDIKGMKKLLKKFGGTLYGRTVFFIAYFFPFLSLLTYVGFAIGTFIVPLPEVTAAFYISVIIFLISFLIGTAYFYRELREFAKETKV